MSSDVALIQDFVNEFNADHADGVTLGEDDVARLRAVREAIRAVLRANNGGPAPTEALALLDAAGRRAPLHIRFSDDGVARLTPAADGADAVVGRVLAALARVQAEGQFARLKACAAEDCQWAYYDESRNRSRTWCSMEVCGNRAKARSYRARAAG